MKTAAALPYRPAAKGIMLQVSASEWAAAPVGYRDGLAQQQQLPVVGSVVDVHGLVVSLQHNGKTGRVISHNDSNSQYIIVVADDDGKQLSLRPANLRLRGGKYAARYAAAEAAQQQPQSPQQNQPAQHSAKAAKRKPAASTGCCAANPPQSPRAPSPVPAAQAVPAAAAAVARLPFRPPPGAQYTPPGTSAGEPEAELANGRARNGDGPPIRRIGGRMSTTEARVIGPHSSIPILPPRTPVGEMPPGTACDGCAAVNSSV